MNRTLQQLIAQLAQAEAHGDAERTISHIEIDSRKADATALFVAQKGERADGHNFIPQALAQGCRAILCEDMPTAYPHDACIITVPDTHQALGEVASAFYNHPSAELTLVGVTGTNGKTSIATLLYRLVQSMGYKAGLFSTVANYIGDEKIASTHTTPDAITLNRMMRDMADSGCQYCFMEVSSHSIVQRRIAGLQFDGGIFTNITHDHLDYHKTFSEYIKAKKAFFDALGDNAFAITNIDDKNGQIMLQNTAARKLTYSLRSVADFTASILEHSFHGMNMTVNGTECFMRFVGAFNAYNLLAIYAAATSLGFDSHSTLVAMSSLTPVDGRFQTLRSTDGKTAIVDYAHTPDALMNVINTINDIRTTEQLICVVGCGGDRDKTKRPEMTREAIKGCNKVILTSDNPRTEDPNDIIADMKNGFSSAELANTLTITDRREAIRTAIMLAQPGDIILIAGKGHETYQEVNGVRSHFDDREEVETIFGTKNN